MSSQGKAGPFTDEEIYRLHILLLKTMLQYEYENGFFPPYGSAELLEKVKENGVKVYFDESLVETEILAAKSMYETYVYVYGETASFKNHLVQQRFDLSKKIWAEEEDNQNVRQECVCIDPSDNRLVIKSNKTRAGCCCDDHQDNQESWGENDVEPSPRQENDWEFHSDTCMYGDMMNIVILKCILAFKQARGVLPAAGCDQLYNMVKSNISHSGLTRRYLELTIEKLEKSFWENVHKDLLFEWNLIPLHREIFELSRRVWGGQDGATADEKESAKTKEN